MAMAHAAFVGLFLLDEVERNAAQDGEVVRAVAAGRMRQPFWLKLMSSTQSTMLLTSNKAVARSRGS